MKFNLYTTFILLLLCSSSLSCKKRNITALKSFGGHLPREGSPSLSSAVKIFIEASWGGGAVCSGVVIASQAILTAAHCLKQKPTQIYFESHDPERNGVFRSVLDYKAHPDYILNKSGPGAFDIGWIKFEGDLPMGFSPAKLLPGVDLLSVGDSLLLRLWSNRTKERFVS